MRKVPSVSFKPLLLLSEIMRTPEGKIGLGRHLATRLLPVAVGIGWLIAEDLPRWFKEFSPLETTQAHRMIPITVRAGKQLSAEERRTLEEQIQGLVHKGRYSQGGNP